MKERVVLQSGNKKQRCVSIYIHHYLDSIHAQLAFDLSSVCSPLHLSHTPWQNNNKKKITKATRITKKPYLNLFQCCRCTRLPYGQRWINACVSSWIHSVDLLRCVWMDASSTLLAEQTAAEENFPGKIIIIIYIFYFLFICHKRLQ